MQVHGYTAGGSIDVTIDGQRMSVPDDTDNRHRQLIAAWEAQGHTIPAYEPPVTAIADIKAEARRRIIAIMDEDRQRNTLAAGLEATMTYGADPANWPSDLQARQAAAMTAWAEIERLRSRSDEIELMDPLPEDVTDDGLWAA